MPLSPKDFSFVNAPTNYGPPNTDFSWLSNLVPDYQKSQLANLELQQRQLQLRGMQQFLGSGGFGPSSLPSDETAGAQPTSDVATAPITGRSAGAMAGDPRGKIPVIIAAAQKYGVDPSYAIRVARSEGLLSFYGDGGKSGGAFQLYTGGGLGNDFHRDTGLNPLDPKNEDATIDYAMRKASEGGWGPWNGAKKIGITGFAGINRGGQKVAAADVPSGDGTATAAIPDTAQQPTGVSTAAPAPEEPVAGGDTSPPFAPAPVKAAASSNAAGPANIKLASIAPNLGGLMPAPPSQVAPTSSAEVAGTQGQGIGTRPSGIGPGPTAAQNVTTRFPGVGQQLGGLLPPQPQTQAPITPSGTDTLAQGPATSTAATTARQPQALPTPETNPEIRKLDAQYRYYSNEADRYAKGAAFFPGAEKIAEQFRNQAKDVQEQRKQVYDRLTAERKLPLETVEKGVQKQTELQLADEDKTFQGLRGKAQTFEGSGRNFLNLSRAILNDPRAYTGIGADRALAWNQIRANWGDSAAAQLQEGLKKVTASDVLNQLNDQRFDLEQSGIQGGRVFKQSADLVQQAAPQLGTTLAGNRMLVEVQSRNGELGSQLYQMALDYRNTHAGRLGDGFDKQVSQYLKEHALYSKDELAHPTLLGAPTIPSAMYDSKRGFNRTAVKDWGEKMGLKPGDAIRRPDDPKSYIMMP
jgi:hypothetical protein